MHDQIQNIFLKNFKGSLFLAVQPRCEGLELVADIPSDFLHEILDSEPDCALKQCFAFWIFFLTFFFS